jgi:hypothetical protein
MNPAPQPEKEGKWQTAARERNCYCGLWDTNPAMYEERGYPLGFCGKCERCGARGIPGISPGRFLTPAHGATGATGSYRGPRRFELGPDGRTSSCSDLSLMKSLRHLFVHSCAL